MKKNHEPSQLPRIASWFLKKILPGEEAHFLLGDFEEIYINTIKKNGEFLARLWLWIQILRNSPGFILNSIYWSVTMFKNYLKVAFRNILKYKGFSFINITGLSIGITACFLITLWIFTELSYDQFHKDKQNVYQVLGQGITKNFETTPIPLAPALKTEIPEIEYATRYEYLQEVLLSHKDKVFYESGIIKVDPSFFKIFSFPFLRGDKTKVLNAPLSLVISEKIAKKYFREKNPIGKTLTLNNQYDFVVSGIIKDIPFNSSLKFEMAILYASSTPKSRINWDNFSPRTFIKLRQGATAEVVNEKISDFIPRHKKGLDVGLSVLPFAKRYLFFSGTKNYIYIFSVIALFILIIACINFLNLSTARSVNRAREISIRKVSGAFRKNIILQFLGESLLLSFVSLLVAMVLIMILLPFFGTLTGKELLLNWRFFIPVLAGIVLFSGIVAGSYPAFFLSAFQPVEILKGNLKSGSKGFLLRKILVVLQFAISIFLIIGTIVIYRQLHFIKNKDIGYEREHVIKISLKGDSKKYYNTYKNELLKDRRIMGVTGMAAGFPFFSWNTGGIDWAGKDPKQKILVTYNYIDYDFTKTMNIGIKEGRDFTREFSTDIRQGCLVNEEMIEVMGLDSAVGAELNLWKNPRKIVGVMKSFNFETMNKKIEPLVLMLFPKGLDFVLIRISPGEISATLEFIAKTWKKTIPTYPFEYRFLDEEYEKMYSKIGTLGKLANTFSLMAVFLACLGLFGLISFSAEQRSKEIGIRKVLGASVSGVIVSLSKEFTRCVLIANIIAWPMAYLAMRGWLDNFAYRTSIGIGTFLLSGFAAFIIAVMTVSYQSIKAALANPVDSLRYE
jgi:ABC-type antimicrobial peptide transport system permease subunit